MIDILAIIEIVPDGESPPEWVPFDLELPTGAYWYRKNCKCDRKRIYYDAADRTVRINGRWHDAVYVIGEVKRTYPGKLTYRGP